MKNISDMLFYRWIPWIKSAKKIRHDFSFYYPPFLSHRSEIRWQKEHFSIFFLQLFWCHFPDAIPLTAFKELKEMNWRLDSLFTPFQPLLSNALIKLFNRATGIHLTSYPSMPTLQQSQLHKLNADTVVRQHMHVSWYIHRGSDITIERERLDGYEGWQG